MKNFFRKIPWVNILIVVLVSALLIGGIVGITAAVKNNKTTISNSAFKRGALDSKGLYVETKTSIYTKDLIECYGLEVEPDFEVSGNYQVFYYDTNKLFLGSTPLMNSQTDGVYTKGEDFPYAKYCRIVISPEAPKDDIGNVETDWKIRFYQVADYANDYKITVQKKQPNIGAENLLVVDESKAGKICTFDTETRMFLEKDSSSNNTYSLINVEGMRSLKIIYEEESLNYSYCFYDKNNKCIFYSEFVLGENVIVLEIPDGAVKFGIIYSPERIPAVYRFS